MGGAPYGWQIPELISAERGVSSHVFASFDPVLKGMSSLGSLLFPLSGSSVPLLHFFLAYLANLLSRCQRPY